MGRHSAQKGGASRWRAELQGTSATESGKFCVPRRRRRDSCSTPRRHRRRAVYNRLVRQLRSSRTRRVRRDHRRRLSQLLDCSRPLQWKVSASASARWRIGATIDCSVFIRDSTDCTIFAACQQFRARDCSLLVHLFCATAPIIEDTRAHFSPLRLAFPFVEGLWGGELVNEMGREPTDCRMFVPSATVAFHQSLVCNPRFYA